MEEEQLDANKVQAAQESFQTDASTITSDWLIQI